MDFDVIPECFVDTNLIETLVPPNLRYNHQKGCGTVTRVMKNDFFDSFALGIIDKDKREVDYLKEFSEVIKSASLVLHKHINRNHFIIQINPAIERFILSNAEEAGISLSDFGLPTEFNKLKKITKSINSKNDLRFKQLFNAIKKMRVPEMERLTNWIAYLKDNRYNVDLEELKKI